MYLTGCVYAYKFCPLTPYETVAKKKTAALRAAGVAPQRLAISKMHRVFFRARSHPPGARSHTHTLKAKSLYCNSHSSGAVPLFLLGPAPSLSLPPPPRPSHAATTAARRLRARLRALWVAPARRRLPLHRNAASSRAALSLAEQRLATCTHKTLLAGRGPLPHARTSPPNARARVRPLAPLPPVGVASSAPAYRARTLRSHANTIRLPLGKMDPSDRLVGLLVHHAFLVHESID